MSRHARRALFLVVSFALLTAIAFGVSSAEPAGNESFFDVEITDTNGPVAEGEPLVVDATVTNTGDSIDQQQIHLKGPEGEIVDSVSGPPVTLAPGERRNVTLTWETSLGDEGAREISVQSNDDYPRQSVAIERGTFLNVTIADTNAPIAAGDRLNVTVVVTTPRETIETTRVRLAIDGSIEDEERSVLMHGEDDRRLLAWNSSERHAGQRTLTVSIDGDSEEMPITIEPLEPMTANGTTGPDSWGSSAAGAEPLTASDEPEPPSSEPDLSPSTADSTDGSETASSTDGDKAEGEKLAALTSSAGPGDFGLVVAFVAMGLASAGIFLASRYRSG